MPATARPDGQTFESPFVAEALWHLGDYDGLILVGTMASMWEEAYQRFARDPRDEAAMALFERATASTAATALETDWLAPVKEALPGDAYVVLLEYGLDAGSLARNVGLLADALQVLPKGASLTLDITHGFRSQPLVTLAALQATTARFDAPYRVKHVRYGMLETLRDHDYASIVDLDEVMHLEAVGRAAYIAQRYGRFTELVEVLPKGHPAISPLERLDEALAFMRMQPATEALRRLSKVFAKDHSASLEPARWVVASLLEGLRDDPSDAQVQYAFARWYLRQRNYAAAVIFFLEAIVTQKCLRLSGPPSGTDARRTAILKLKAGTSPEAVHYNRLRKLRNAVAHASAPDARQTTGDIALLKEAFHELHAYFAP